MGTSSTANHGEKNNGMERREADGVLQAVLSEGTQQAVMPTGIP